jgi:chromosome segregation ATPase
MLTYLQPGFREMRRWCSRAAHHWALHFKRRKLAQAETRLGLLGWQQAEFEGEARRQVEAIHHLEKEQATLTNRSAEIARELERIAAERAATKDAFETLRADITAEREKARQPLEDLSRELAGMRDREPEMEKKASRIDEELAEVERLYNDLLVVQPQTDKIRDQIMHLRERLIALPNQRTDLRAGLTRIKTDIRERDEKVARIEEQTREFDERLKAARTAFEEKDAPLAERQRTLEKEKAQAEKTVEQIERGKADPYRAIGSVLADSDIAPLNQPEALHRVHSLRHEIAEREAAIAAALEASRREDRAAMQASLIVWGVIAIGLLLLLLALR